MEPFKYKKSRRPKPEGTDMRTPILAEEEEYTGVIDGFPATQGEENVYKAAYKTGMVRGHVFRMAVGAPRNRPGWKELDFLFQTKYGNYVAIQIRDYDFIHKGATEETKDVYNDMYILQKLSEDGIALRDGKIHTIDDNDAITVEVAEKALEKILL